MATTVLCVRIQGSRHEVELLIANNPEDSTLPFIILIPLAEPVVLRARDTWPRTSKIYCHRHGLPWPDEPEIVERIPLRSCVKRGGVISVEADRAREPRSQFVITQARGREMIFWQNARTNKAARPNVALPTARASGIDDLEIVVDTREKYAWKFSAQQATTRKQALPVGDYGVYDGEDLVAVVERKGLADLAGSLSGGKMAYRLEELAKVPRAAVVVEERYSQVFKLTHVRPSLVAEALAECQVRHPSVPIIFTDTRQLAQEWTYRFLGAALREHRASQAATWS